MDPTDLTDEEWLFIQPFGLAASERGRKPETDLRDVLYAPRYLARADGGWRMLPNDFPSWQTVYWWFRRFMRRLLLQTIHDVTLMLDREREGREHSPTAAVSHSQSINAPAPEKHGFDAGKKECGRPLMVNLTAADTSDSAGAQQIVAAVHKR